MERPLTISLWGEAWRLESASLRTIIVLIASVKLKSSWCWTCSFMFEEWLHIRLTKYLFIEVIIEIAPKSPKAIVVRIYGSKSKQRHSPPQPPRSPHPQKILGRFIEQQWEDKSESPHGWRLPCGIEVDMLVAPSSSFVTSLRSIVWQWDANFYDQITLKTVSQHEFWQ